MPELLEAAITAIWEIAEAVPRVITKASPEEKATAIVLAFLGVILTGICSKQVRQRFWLMVVWLGKQVWHGFRLLLRILGLSLRLVGRAASGTANGCRRLWERVQAMRRERIKRRVIEKLRCYEARGKLPAEQVGFLVQAIALL